MKANLKNWKNVLENRMLNVHEDNANIHEYIAIATETTKELVANILREYRKQKQNKKD